MRGKKAGRYLLTGTTLALLFVFLALAPDSGYVPPHDRPGPATDTINFSAFDVDIASRELEAGAMDMIAIKVARVGGLTKARKMRDLALDLGISVVPDDAWGSEIVSSSVLHYAASTDPRYLICYTDLTDYVSFKTADGFPERDGPNITASDAPGLGLTLREDALGEPIHVVE